MAEFSTDRGKSVRGNHHPLQYTKLIDHTLNSHFFFWLETAFLRYHLELIFGPNIFLTKITKIYENHLSTCLGNVFFVCLFVCLFVFFSISLLNFLFLRFFFFIFGPKKLEFGQEVFFFLSFFDQNFQNKT